MSKELPVGTILTTPPDQLPVIGDLVEWYHGPDISAQGGLYPTLGVVIDIEERNGIAGTWVHWSDDAGPMWSPTMMLKLVE